MPTGYTAAVQDGTITKLAPFAMQCARAFGALVLMRDAPADAPIPQAFKPSPFYLERRIEAERRLAQLLTFSPLDAQRACQQEHTAATARWRDRCVETAKHRVRYQAMLDQVQAWPAPRYTHDNFKKFMHDQLRESIAFDCDNENEPAPVLQRWPEWLQANIRLAQRDIRHSQCEYGNELARTAQRNDWLTGLRASLDIECVNYIVEAA